MKKRIVALTIILFILTGQSTFANATERSVTSQMQEAANRLNAIDLFRGIGNNSDGTPNFALSSGLTRYEAATLFVRLMGKENEANAITNFTHPFTDGVRGHWSEPYVDYCYKNGIINGVSATAYDGNSQLSFQHLATLTLRVMGYTDSGASPDFSYGTVVSDISRFINIPRDIDTDSRAVLRGEVVLLADAMMSSDMKSGTMFLQALVDQGIVSASAAQQAGYPIQGNTVVTPPITNPSERTPTQPYYAEYQSTVTNPANGYTGWYRDQGGFDIPLEQSVYLENGVIMNDPRVINRDRVYGTGSNNAHQVVEVLNYVIGIMNSLDSDVQFDSNGRIVENSVGMWKTMEHSRALYTYRRSLGQLEGMTSERYIQLLMGGNDVELPVSERNLAIVQSCSAPGAKRVSTTGVANAYNAYNAINPDWTRGTNCAIWAAYSQVFLDILGVPNQYNISDAKNHAWVSVEVDGVWYHNVMPDHLVTNPLSVDSRFSDWRVVG